MKALSTALLYDDSWDRLQESSLDVVTTRYSLKHKRSAESKVNSSKSCEYQTVDEMHGQDLAVLLAAANAGDKHLYPLIYPIQLTALLLFLQFGLQHYGVFYLLSHYISVIG